MSMSWTARHGWHWAPTCIRSRTSGVSCSLKRSTLRNSSSKYTSVPPSTERTSRPSGSCGQTHTRTPKVPQWSTDWQLVTSAHCQNIASYISLTFHARACLNIWHCKKNTRTHAARTHKRIHSYTPSATVLRVRLPGCTHLGLGLSYRMASVQKVYLGCSLGVEILAPSCSHCAGSSCSKGRREARPDGWPRPKRKDLT